MDVVVFDLAAEREAELGLGLEPVGAHLEAVPAQIAQHVEEIGPDEVRQHEAVVQDRAPAGEFAGLRLRPVARDEGADQELLGERHARVGRHLEAAELDEAEPAGGAVGRVELVDADLGAVGVAGDVGEHVAQQTVDAPGRGVVAFAGGGDLRHGDLELVERVLAALVDARGLAGRADEEAREEVGHRGVPLPVQDEAAEQVGAAQERAVERGGAADDDVVAAAGAGVAAVDHVFVGAEAALAGLLVDALGDRLAIVPVRRRMDVDLEHAGIGRDADHVEARIVRRGVAFDVDGQAEVLRGGFRGRDEFEIILDVLGRRHEDAEPPVAGLDAERGAHGAVEIAEFLFDALLTALGGGEGGDLWRRRSSDAASAVSSARSRSKSGSGPRGTVGSATWV